MSYGIWDVGRKKWMPDPLLGHMSRRPESFKTRGEAERTADREWRKLNPDVKFEVRPLPSTEESRRTRKPSAHKAGADYAHEQLAGSYFQDWVWEQMVEAERMRRSDPSSVLPIETQADARKIARNMFQQLKWDTKRALKESKEFFEGFDEVLQSQSSIDWLADMILDFDKEAREKTAPEAREARKESETREAKHEHRAQRGNAQLDTLLSGAQRTVSNVGSWSASFEDVYIWIGDTSGSRSGQYEADVNYDGRSVQLQSRSYDALCRQIKKAIEELKGGGAIEGGGIGDPAIVPAGKETRETYDLPRAKQHRKGVDYYETASDAQKVRNHILPQYPEARVVRYELGWAVQLYKSGPYYPEPALVPVGAETREASGRCQLAWSRTTQASTATGAKGLFKVESKPDGWYVTLDGGKLGVYAERKGAERAAERFEADEHGGRRRKRRRGREAREARRGSRGKKTFEAYALEVEQALVASGVRPGQAAVWTSNHGAFIDKELKDGASANDTAERILESERESSIPYGRESRRPVAPYYSRKR